MKLKHYLVLLAFLPAFVHAQDTIVRNFSATVTLSGMTLYSAGKYQGTMLVNDQTGKYRANSVAIGDLVYTNNANSYVVDTVVSSTISSVVVRLRQTAGAATIPNGVGYISRPAKNYGVPFFTPDNQNGISSQLQAIAMSNLVYKIDSLIKSSGVKVDTIQLNGEVVGGIYNTMLDTVNRIRFNTAYNPAADTVGYLRWDSGNGTLSLGLLGGNVALQLGQEEVHRVRNDAGVNLVDGDIVYISGSQGDRPKVKKADADVEASSSITFGVVTEPIASGQDGFVTVSGYVRNVNTNGLVEGGAIWLDTIPGKFTQTKPQAPVNAVLVGYVIRAMNNGTIFVKVQNGYELDELHDVSITSPRNNSIILYDSIARLWRDTAIESAIGAGTPGYIPKWKTGGGLENSIVMDSANAVYISKNTTRSIYMAGNTLRFEATGANNSNLTTPYDAIGALEWAARKNGNMQAYARMYAWNLDTLGTDRYGRLTIGTGHNGDSFGGNQLVIQSRTQNRKQVLLGDGYLDPDDTTTTEPVVIVSGTPSFGRDLFEIRQAGGSNTKIMSVNVGGNIRFRGYTKISDVSTDVSAPSNLLDIRGESQQLLGVRRIGGSQGAIVIGNTGFTPIPGNTEMGAIRVTSPYVSSVDSLVKYDFTGLGLRFNKIGSNWYDTTLQINTYMSNLRYTARLLTKNTDEGDGIFSVYPQGSGSVAIAQRMNVINGGDARLPAFGDTVSLGVTGTAHFSDKVRIGRSPNDYANLPTTAYSSSFFVNNVGFADAFFMRQNNAAGITIASSNGTPSSPTSIYNNIRYGAINARYYHGGAYQGGIPIEFITSYDTIAGWYGTKIQLRHSDATNELVINRNKVGINTLNPSFSLDILGTDAIKIPVGLTSERPSSIVDGLLRYNSTTKNLEASSDGAYYEILNYKRNTGNIVYDSAGVYATTSLSNTFSYDHSNNAIQLHSGSTNKSYIQFRTGQYWYSMGLHTNNSQVFNLKAETGGDRNILSHSGSTNILTLGTGLTLTADNKLGVKNASPAYDLDVTGTGNFTTTLRVGGELTLATNTSVNPTKLLGVDGSNVAGSTLVDTSMIIKPGTTGTTRLGINHAISRYSITSNTTVTLPIGNTTTAYSGGFSSVTKITTNKNITTTLQLPANYANNIIDGSVHTIHILIVGSDSGNPSIVFPSGKFFFDDATAMNTQSLTASKLYTCYYDKTLDLFYCNK